MKVKSKIKNNMGCTKLYRNYCGVESFKHSNHTGSFFKKNSSDSSTSYVTGPQTPLESQKGKTKKRILLQGALGVKFQQQKGKIN